MPGSLTRRLSRILPIIEWGGSYRRSDIKGDLAAGLTVGAMLVPQAMAYAMLAGLPPEIGKDFMLSHGYIENDFDVHEWAAPEFLEKAAKELLEERWQKVTAAKLPEPTNLTLG